jgi:hypothetical protein
LRVDKTNDKYISGIQSSLKDRNLMSLATQVFDAPKQLEIKEEVSPLYINLEQQICIWNKNKYE